ncbi:hypothetical protein RA307_31385 [Xanthobacteraceae bacterium Astr-EGSB]|uniref:hypothetical protein n=1 Tax=Astrobacterium formosum TaxID=3069710 RepID=UPI0027B4B579|nr:hypothetical protein [Xanthobacteraceae bacterium Astr-EGSB]
MTRPTNSKVMLPPFYREAAIVAGSLDEEARTFDILWTAGAEVPRVDWYSGDRYVEVLEVSDTAVRLDRLKSGRAPVLDSHARWSLNNVLGVIDGTSVRIDAGKGYAKVRLSSRADVAPIVADIRDRIIANVSPGYVVHSYREELRDKTLYRVVMDWEPMEISFVPVGADPEAGRRNAPDGPTYPCLVVTDLGAKAFAAAARMRMRQASVGGR